MLIWIRILAFVAGLFGAAGVGAAAVAAHLSGGASLATAATFLMVHAAGLAALSALALGTLALQTQRGRIAILVGASAIALGTVLFSGDLALRALMGIKLLWGTAPVGGTLMMAGWIVAGIGGASLARPRATGVDGAR